MKLFIQITEHELESKEEVEVPVCQVSELELLFHALQSNDNHTLANMIPAILSVGSDVLFQRYLKHNLKSHETSFDLLWNENKKYLDQKEREKIELKRINDDLPF